MKKHATDTCNSVDENTNDYILYDSSDIKFY